MKRLTVATIAVLVGKIAVGAIAFTILNELYSNVYANHHLYFRAEENEKHLPGMLIMILWAFAFTYLFSKGYEQKGWGEGLRFGLIIWILYFIPMTVGFWAYTRFPDELVLPYILIGLAESLADGLIIAGIFMIKKLEPVS